VAGSSTPPGPRVLVADDSEERFRTLLEALPVGVFRSLPDGRFESANPCLLEMIGLGGDCDVRDLRWQDLLADPSQADEIRATLDASDGPVELEVRARRLDGTTFCAQVHVKPSTVGGSLVRAEGIVTDVTRRRELEQALLQGKREWESTFDAVREMVLITDLDLNVSA